MADVIAAHPSVRDKLQVVFVPNYGVTLAQFIIPATELSEQISTAGYEASGTGNMKFMLNGALTLGTLDGANVEIRDEVGEENFFRFGLDSNEVQALRAGYNPKKYIEENDDLKRIIRQQEVSAAYRDRGEWTTKAIVNVARSGKFSSDRAVAEYARNIWNVSPLSPHEPL